MDIPISEGPYKFGGLPGLIVQIYDTQMQFRFDLVRVVKPSGIKPIYKAEEVDCVLVSNEDYFKAFKTYLATLYNGIQREDRIKFDNDESKAGALNNVKERNNLIESIEQEMQKEG